MAGDCGYSVRGYSRSSSPPVNLAKKETFSNLDSARIVVNLSADASTSPEELIQYCLQAGKTWIECSSEAKVIRSLHGRFRDQCVAGRLILGAGIFTGLSNLMAAASIEKIKGEDEPYKISLVLRSSPFSGCGESTVDLMVQAFHAERYQVREGQIYPSSGVAAGPRIQVASGHSIPTICSPLPEVLMLHHSTGIPNIEGLFSPLPTLLCRAFTWIPSGISRTRWYQSGLRAYFKLLRTKLFKSRVSQVEMHTVVHGGEKVVRGSFRTEDGFGIAALVISYLVKREAARAKAGPGCFFIDEVLEFDSVIRDLKSQKSGPSFLLEWA